MMRVAILAAALAAQGIVAAQAQSTDPAIMTVSAVDDALLSSMRHGGDAAELGSVIDENFNVTVMSEFIVGAAWVNMSPAERSAVSGAVRRYLIARFAHEFDTYGGEQFRIDLAVQARGPDRLVHTQIIAPGQDPTRLDYRLRAYGGTWRVIDVYYDGVSEVTTQRADVASALAGGVGPLIARIDAATRSLH